MAEEEGVIEVAVTEEESSVQNGGTAEETSSENIEEEIQVKMYQSETTITKQTTETFEEVIENGGDVDEVECEAELVEESLELVDKDSNKATAAEESAAEENVVAEDKTEDQVTDIEEDRGKLERASAQPSLDDVVEIPVEVDEGEAPAEAEESSAEPKGVIEVPVADEASAEEAAAAASEESEELVEIPVQVVSEEELTRLREPDGDDVVIIPVEVTEEEPAAAAAEPEPEAAAEPEPEPEPVKEAESEPEPAKEPTPPAPEPEPEPEPVKAAAPPEPEPVKAAAQPEPEPTPPPTPKDKLKKQGSFKSSKTPSVDVSEPSTPTTKKAVSFKGSKTPSVDEPKEVEKAAPSPPEEVKEEPAQYKELAIEEDKPVEEAPAEAPAEEAPVESPAEEAPAEAPAEEAPVESPAEEAPAETPAEEEAPAPKKAAETKEEKTAEREPSPPPATRRVSVERPSRRQLREEGIVPPPLAPAPQPTPPPPRVSYVTYSSYAPPTVHTPAYVPYSSQISTARKFQNEYTSGYSYRPPTSVYMHSFDNAVKTGSFSQNLWSADRARSRSRGLERRQQRSTSSHGANSTYGNYGSYGPPPLKRRDLSLPSYGGSRSSSANVSRSTSFTNLMDYVESKNYELRRSRSRESFSLSRTPSRSTFVNSSDALNNYFAAPISRVDSYVQKINEPYESKYESSYGRYTARPYSPYIAASHHYERGIYPRDDSSTRRLKRWMIDAATPSTVRSLYEGRIEELERNLIREREARNRIEQDRSFMSRELDYANRSYGETRRAASALDTALTVNRSLRGRVEDMERRYTGYPYYTPPYYGLTPSLYPTRRYYMR